jgi:hypothetical protein
MVAWLLRSLLKMRLNATRLGSIASSRSFGDQLDDLAGQVPSLDLNFAQNKSLIDDYSGTTLVTFTRASSGTYVDSEGVIRTATTNLLLRSEEFDVTWNKPAGVTVTANTTEAPNGTQTADTLSGAINVSHNGTNLSQAITATESKSYIFSIYVKSLTATTFSIRLRDNTTESSSTTITPTSSWQRVSCTLTTGIGATSLVARVGNANGDVAIWGAQLEQSATVGEYVPTTSTINSAPRFDHNPTTGESLGLLVEESRTNLLVRSEEFDDASWTKASATITANESTAPDGTTTADLWTRTGSTSAVNQSYTKDATARTYSASIWVKSSVTAFTLALDSGSNTNRGKAVFNLATGVLTTIDNIGTFTNTSGTITAYPDSWYRVTVTTTTSTATTVRFIVFFSAPGETARIWGAQLEENVAFPTSYIPTVAATATRAADVASITGSNFGVTRTNLLVRSEEFDDAAWTKSNSSITANTIVAPDGTLTGDKLVEDTATAAHQLTVNLPFDYVSGTTYTLSCYIKAASRSKFQLAWRSDWFPSDNNLTADLSTGTISVGVNATGTITAVGNGWYRISVTSTADATGSSPSDLFMRLVSDAGSLTYTGDGTSGLYIWGAQLEVGSAVTPYIQSPSVFTSRASSGTYVGGNGLIQTATTNEARYDHDPVSLISKGLLLEEARTNLVLRSEEFDNAYWTKSGATVSADQTASPIGTVTADKLIESAANSEHWAGRLFLGLPSAIYTCSIYAKAAERTELSIFIDTSVNRRTAYFNVSNGTLGAISTGITSTIQNIGNGWYRCSITLDAAEGMTNAVYTAAIGNSNIYLGDGTSGIYFWGAQLEVGAFPTSYIPTTSATVTRAADISTSVATSVFESSWYRQDEGTNLIEFRETDRTGTRTPRSLSDGTASSRIDAFLSSSLTVNNRLAIAGVSYNPGNSTLSAAGTVNKHVASAAPGSAIAVTNGTLSTESAPPSLPVVNRIVIGADSIGGTPFTGTISRLTYWPTRLGNEVLQRITQ